MSDPVIVTVCVRGGLAILIALIGGWCVYLGAKLLFGKYQNRSESAFDATIFGHKLSFSTGAAGTAVVFTSAVWVIGAIYTAPKLALPGGTSVAMQNGGESVEPLGAEKVATLVYSGDIATLTEEQKKSLDLLAAQLGIDEYGRRLVIESSATFGPSALTAEKRTHAILDYMVKHHAFDATQIQSTVYNASQPESDKGKIAVSLKVMHEGEVH